MMKPKVDEDVGGSCRRVAAVDGGWQRWTVGGSRRWVAVADGGWLGGWQQWTVGGRSRRWVAAVADGGRLERGAAGTDIDSFDHVACRIGFGGAAAAFTGAPAGVSGDPGKMMAMDLGEPLNYEPEMHYDLRRCSNDALYHSSLICV